MWLEWEWGVHEWILMYDIFIFFNSAPAPTPAQQVHDYHRTEERRVLMLTPNSGKCHCLWCWQLDIMSNPSPCGFHHVVKKKKKKKSVVWRLLRVRNLLVSVFMLRIRDIPGPTYTVLSSIRLNSLYSTFFFFFKSFKRNFHGLVKHYLR